MTTYLSETDAAEAKIEQVKATRRHRAAAKIKAAALSTASILFAVSVAGVIIARLVA